MEMIQWKSISSSSSLPNDLTTEILLRLPKKCIARFHCVSKLWLSITTDPYFISLFEIRNPRSRLLLCFKEGNKFVVSSISQHNLTFDHQNPATTTDHTYRMKFPKFTHSWSLLTDSVHGLICFQKSTNTPIVWNPSTRKVITLPEPSKEVEWRSSISFFLGYDEVEGKHKVLAMPSYSRSCRVSRVITLGGGSSTQEEESSSSSWRTLKTNQKHTTNPFNDIAQCIKGFIYYLASSYENVPVIMRFDVRYEKLDAIQLPSPDIYVYRLITYEGRLACVRKGNNGKITLSILEDADENKWSSKDLLAPFDHYDRSSNISFRVQGFTHAGEFIYKPYDYHVYHKSLVVLFFDPVRNSFRRFGFKRTAYDEERLSRLFVFPNHIETHLSL